MSASCSRDANPLNPTSRRQDVIELSAAIATAVIHVLPLERFYPEVMEIVVICIAWVGYLGYLLLKDRPRLAAMGFQREGLRPATFASLVVLGVASLGMAAYGLSQGTFRFNSNMLILLALYPAYGWVQQWLIQGVLARQLATRVPAWVTVVVTSAIFGSLHLPDMLATVGTFVLGLAVTPIYLRWRNVWPIGVIHAWLAIPLYFWVAGVDPWALAMQHR